ncbi:MAG: diguanylate cyclase [Xenococcaceae cyanobacterium MO_188.B32]|nr:diguanylate cyclase [Xenococcaceae cyanobacterium MO_188.B32]
MDINTLKILLIEDNPADADWIGEILIEEKLAGLKLKHANRVNEGLHILSQDYFDAVLLDLSLPDSQGIDNIAMVKQQAPELPIIVLTSLNDQNMAIKSVRKGAQDYLIKGGFEKELLIRSIRYAIERQRTKETLRQQAERERLMGKMLEKIRQSLELTEILETTVDEVRQFLKTDRVLIYCCESSRPGKIVAESQINENCCFSKQKVSSEANSFELYLAVSDADHLQAVTDIQQIQASSSDIYRSTEHQLRTILTLPIWRGQQVYSDRLEKCEYNLHNPIQRKEQLWGMLVAHSYDTSRQWQKWEVDFLKQLTTQVTIAIQQSELYSQLQQANQQLQQLAILDGLTGVANRRYFDRVLSNEWNRLAREEKPLSLILCDIDYFKIYNDTYGHPEGDSCLQKVANALQQATKRAADLVTRYGGEEFAVILPDTDARGALFVAENIRQKLNTQKIPHPASSVSPYITISIGVATTIPTAARTASRLLKIADNALYQAKKQGRDRIIQGSS